MFSEVMRDCDLFVGVTSIGTDPAWSRDHPDDPHLPYWQQFAFGDLTSASEHRRAVLEGLLAEAGDSRPVPAGWPISRGSRGSA